MKEAELVGLGDVSHKKKRRFPMDDLMLIREDAFYQDRTGKSLPARPPMRADPLDNHELKGCTPDVVFVHQCFRGGLGFDRGLTPEFSVQVLSAALKELGSAYCTTGGRFPVLLTQLFVSALEKVVFKRVEGKDEDEESSEEESWEDTEEDTDEEQEVPRGKRDRHKAAPPSEIDERYLQLGYFEDIISPITWPEVLIHYLETQQNFHVREKDVQKELVEDLRNAKVSESAAVATSPCSHLCVPPFVHTSMRAPRSTRRPPLTTTTEWTTGRTRTTTNLDPPLRGRPPRTRSRLAGTWALISRPCTRGTTS